MTTIKTNWIRVEERLPEDFTIVITWNGRYVETGFCYHFGPESYRCGDLVWTDAYNDNIPNVTKWQLLPEPPK